MVMFVKQFAFVAVVILSIFAQPIFAATHTVTFTENDLLFSEANGYDRVLLGDGAYLTEFGKPQLPTKALRVAILPGSKVTAITIDKFSKTKLEGNFMIAPAQEMELECLPPPSLVEPHPGVYGQASEYPGNLVARVGESYVDGSYEVAHLLVYPLQYVPLTGDLYLYKSITFTLTLEKGGPNVPNIRLRKETSRQSTDLMLRETVINPEDLGAYRILPQQIQNNGAEVQQFERMLAPAKVEMGAAEYIIITSDTTMADAFKPLADWRIKKGITSEIVTVPWIESNYNGIDIQQKIKNFIYDSYIIRGTQHVLLGGTSDLVPIRYSYIYHYDDLHNGEAATDLYYSNASVGDEEWIVHTGPKSPTPHVTYNPPDGSSINALIPRVNVGRLLVADEYQAADVANKILTYERVVPEADCQQTFLHHAADEGGRIGIETFADGAIPDYLTPFTRTLIADGSDADDQSTPENIVSFMTGGSDLGVPFNFVWNWSHGNSHSLSTNTGGFYGSHIDQIVNEPRFNGSFYAWACTSAPIGSTDLSTLAAKWTNMANGGGLAWMGASVIAGGDEGVWHARYYHEEMWEQSDDYHHHNLGRAFAEAKTRMIENFAKPFDPSLPRAVTTWAEYHAIIWNLVGDPLVSLFNQFPRTVDVSVSPDQVRVGLATTIDITAKDGGKHVDGALVNVLKADEDVYLTGYTDANGLSQFQLPPLSIAGEMDVTVSKHNYRPHEAVLAVSEDRIPWRSLVIVDVDVPVRPRISDNLFDGDLATSWYNDGDRANAWFDVTLDARREIKQLRLAPRVNAAYTLNVYVDGDFVASYTTESTNTVTPQTFDLPPGTVGTVVRVESNSNWFRVHEIELWGEASAKRARFAVIGDLGNPDEPLPEAGNGAYVDEVADLVNTLAPDFIVTVGDNNQKGQPTSPETFAQAVGRFYGPGAAVDYISAGRFYPAIGNHDVDGGGPDSGLEREAEAFDANVTGTGACSGATWQSVNDPAASGWVAMQARDSGRCDTPEDGARLAYDIDFPSAEDYYLCLRGQASGFGSDSLWFGLDGDFSDNSISGYQPFGDYVYTNDTGQAIVNVPSAGTHRFMLAARERNNIVDRFVLTQSASCPPTEDATEFAFTHYLDYFDDGPGNLPAGPGNGEYYDFTLDDDLVHVFVLNTMAGMLVDGIEQTVCSDRPEAWLPPATGTTELACDDSWHPNLYDILSAATADNWPGECARVDSNQNALAAQACWLRDQLAASTATWNVVVMHFSPFSSGARHGSHPALRWPFEAWGAYAVLSGHDHIYELILDSADVNNDGNPLPYVIVPSGGWNIRDLRAGCEPGVGEDPECEPGSQARYNRNTASDRDFGALLVAASDQCLSVDLHTIDPSTDPGSQPIHSYELCRDGVNGLQRETEAYDASIPGTAACSDAIWQEVNDPAASGGAAMQASASSRCDTPEDGAMLAYDIDFPSVGDYYLCLRGRASGFGSDSLWFGLDGNFSNNSISGYQPFGDYVYTNDARQAIINVPNAGRHRFMLATRERNNVVDGFNLTTSPDCPLSP